ncbi:ESX secretion-associated protein EspG [Amycolatopsis sp. NPDC059657]|uniref:ESX secretion-associated protein EspG n=1 Tax=Amycolatopsis sp. NPDC059657 TaxID=3346899 RepID=UPI0036702858
MQHGLVRHSAGRVDFRHGAGDGNRAGRDGLAEPRRPGSEDYLRELMHARRDAVHQLYAAVRDRSGARRRSLPLSAIDLTDEGRILTYLTDNDEGEEEINLVSATPRKLVAILAATLDEL